MNFFCLELIPLPKQEQARRVTAEDATLATLQTHPTANTLPGARTAPRFPDRLQPPAGFSAQWGKKKKKGKAYALSLAGCEFIHPPEPTRLANPNAPEAWAGPRP